MIDRLFIKGSDDFEAAYQPEEAIVDSFLENPDSHKVAVVFPHWHANAKSVGALTSRFVKSGYTVLGYQFHDRIMEPNVDRVVKSFSKIRDTILCDIAELDHSEVHLVWLSLNNVAMAMVAGEGVRFSKATFVLAGSDLARAMWAGAKTQNIRLRLEEQGVTEEDLALAWEGLAPGKYAGAFAGKEVRAIYSGVDRIVPASFQHEMIGLLESKARIGKIHSRLGHAANITKFCFSRAKI